MADEQTFYAQFQQEVDGTLYELGDPIDANMHAGTRNVLVHRGDIATTRPGVMLVPPPASTDVADMDRSQLISAIRLEMPLDGQSDDDLRNGLERIRSEVEDRESEAREGEEGRPLASMTTAQLTATAEAEGVTFGDDVKTNPDRVKAIQAKRDAGKS